jgi:hypothetical protein
VYRPAPRTEISDALAHLRELHRQITPSNDHERNAFERRELITKNLLSNLRRTGDHPTLSMLLEIADMFSLTIEGAHRLFGYDLGGMREYDLRLNGGRTHIERSHERLSPREVHRSLCVGHTRERKCGKHRPQRARRLNKLSFREGLRPSLDTIGGVAT